MPIEIRELHIKVAVTGTGPAQSGGGGASAGAAGDAAGEQAQQAIVAQCVEQVLRILQNKMER